MQKGSDHKHDPQPNTDPSIKKFMMEHMRQICRIAPYRIVGSEDEKKGAEYFKKEYEKYADEVVMEEFQCAPGAYPGGMIKPIGWFYLLSIGLYFVFPIISWLNLIPLMLWALELFGLKRAIDWAYPKVTSYNVFAKIKPNKEVKRIMIFAGHNDSPFIFPITANFRKKAFPIILSILFLALSFNAVAIVRAVLSWEYDHLLFPQAQHWIWLDSLAVILAAVSLPGVMWVTQSFVSNIKCMGANDNLSGALSALAMAKYFHENRPDNIELWFVAFGGEEAGQRGSTAFVLNHLKELKEKDALMVNFESVGGGTYLLLATEETMCIPHIKHQPEVYNLLKEASEHVPIRRQCLRSKMEQGYTDAEPFSRYGIKASTFVGLMPDGFPLLWHVETDIPDSIHPDCMRDAIEVAIEAVKIQDERENQKNK